MGDMSDHPVNGFLFANALKMARAARNGALNAEKDIGWMANHGYVCIIMVAVNYKVVLMFSFIKIQRVDKIYQIIFMVSQTAIL